MPLGPSKQLLEFMENWTPIQTDSDPISDEEESDEEEGEEGKEEVEEEEEEEKEVAENLVTTTAPFDIENITPAELARAFALSLLAIGLDVRTLGSPGAAASQDTVNPKVAMSLEAEISAENDSENIAPADSAGEPEVPRRYSLRHPSLLKPTERAKGILRR